jgi:hypothetical protein
MFDLITILDEHRELMLERGYADIGLGTAEEPGIYMQQLEQQFSFHIQDTLFKKDNREFDLKAIGFFNEEQHLVNFLFHYKLDARNKMIELKSLQAEMNGVTKQFILHRNMYQLPNSKTIVSALMKELQLVNVDSPVHSHPTADLETTSSHRQVLLEHKEALAEKGYTNKEYFPYREGFLFKKLEAKVSKRFYDPNERQDFLIRTHGFFDAQNDEVKFNFFYTVNSSEHLVQLNSMVAELGDKRIVYPMKEANDLPPALNVWKHLTNNLIEEKTQVIYPKEKIKIELREQEKLLGFIGYYKTVFSNDTNFIERQLKGLLENSLNEKEIKIIPINRQIHLNVHDTMKCCFQYQFDPIQVSLKLERLTATVGIVERAFFPSEPSILFPTLQNIYKELENENRLLKAGRISRSQDNSGLRIIAKDIQTRRL